MFDWIPEFLRSCKCCKWNRKARYFEMARERLDAEVNIIEILKSRRYYDKAFKFLLTKE